MNIEELVEVLQEHSLDAKMPKHKRFLAEYLQFSLMGMLYDRLLDCEDDASRVKDMLPQFADDVFKALAVDPSQREEMEREIFQKFQDRYAVIFKAFPADLANPKHSSSNESEARILAITGIADIFVQVFHDEELRMRILSHFLAHDALLRLVPDGALCHESC